jgi:hypothetical protein
MSIIPAILNTSRLKTRNKTEAQFLLALETAFMILCKELQIIDTTFYAQRQKGFGSSDAWHAGMYTPTHKDYNKGEQILASIKINFRNLGGATLHQFIKVLGHEFRHAVQTKNNWGRGSGWKGPTQFEETRGSNYNLGLSYFNSPQEKDARQFEETYAQIIYNDPSFKQFLTLTEKVCGKALMIPDRTASLIKHGFTEEEVPGICLFNQRDKTVCYMHFKQLGLKKWTKKGYRLAWDSVELYTQKYNEIMRPLSYDDLVY